MRVYEVPHEKMRGSLSEGGELARLVPDSLLRTLYLGGEPMQVGELEEHPDDMELLAEGDRPSQQTRHLWADGLHEAFES